MLVHRTFGRHAGRRGRRNGEMLEEGNFLGMALANEKLRFHGKVRASPAESSAERPRIGLTVSQFHMTFQQVESVAQGVEAPRSSESEYLNIPCHRRTNAKRTRLISQKFREA